VISGILDIKNTNVRKKRLLVKGKNNSLKIYLLMVLMDLTPVSIVSNGLPDIL